MIKIDNRESAHVRSRVKDLSIVPNIATFNGLLACITPISKLKKNEATNLYEPILVRDVDTLIANFGDPRIDPEKYVDLYTIMQLVANGGTCWVSKVNSGEAGVYEFAFVNDPHRDMTENLSGKVPSSPDSGKTWTITDLKNKYAVVKVTGSSSTDTISEGDLSASTFYSLELETNAEEPSAVPDAGNIDYTGYFTYKCEEQNNGEFTITINITTDDKHPAPDHITVEGKIDENWGVEPIKFTKNSDGTWTAAGLSARYVITELSDHVDADTEHSTPETNTPIAADKIEGMSWSEVDGKWSVTVKLANDAVVSGHDLIASEAARGAHSMVGYSSMAEDLTFDCNLQKAKPWSLNAYYLNVAIKNNGGLNTIASARVKIDGDTVTNKSIVNNLNSALGTVMRFELIDPMTADACAVKENGLNSLAVAILHEHGRKDTSIDPNPTPLVAPVVISKADFKVSIDDYVDALKQYNDKRYNGRLMADMVCPVTSKYDASVNPNPDKHTCYQPSYEERRTLHYYMKDIARERKDTVALLSTPYYKNHAENFEVMDMQDACNWVASQGDYTDLWEYGQGATTDYATQSFYLEMYYSWLEMTCTKIANGEAKSVKVKVAPANLVIDNVLTSWRERGVQYPVAGDQGGVLPETVAVLQNPKTKLERDQLVQYRINPIWDTGTRGVQIFGNETLNAGYTDLNAAHIARLLVYIRSVIDEYTETLKFSINSLVLWDKWKNYVSQNILDPLVSSNALAEYMVEMGEDTTSPEEIANRQINAVVRLRFYQAAEIFDLSYVVYSSSTTIEEAMNNV
jgi:hypothetical protein